MLQGIPKTARELKAEKGKIWSKLFFATLFLSLIFNAIDTGKIFGRTKASKACQSGKVHWVVRDEACLIQNRW